MVAEMCPGSNKVVPSLSRIQVDARTGGDYAYCVFCKSDVPLYIAGGYRKYSTHDKERS